MKISPQEITKVANLARLKLDEQTTERLTNEMNDILSHMDKLAELDTSGVVPTNHALELTGAMREDKARPSLEREEGLANAPVANDEAFVVPRII